MPNETRLLVLDPEADAYYQERGIQVNGSQSNVVYLKTPTANNQQKNGRITDSSEEDDDNNRVQLRHDAKVSSSSRRKQSFH